MKVGILTFHSQLNYGGVLQCWALKTALEHLGHEVVVVDRWFDSRNRSLRGVLSCCTVRELLRFALDVIFLNGGIGTLFRIKKTTKFIREHLNLSSYHFVNWGEAPESLGVDCIVVGSDQVWNSLGNKDPRPYFLTGAPDVDAISYAASFGMLEVCEKKRPWYETGLGRFSRLSVREESGRRLVNEFGYSAEVVVDPTMLLTRLEWDAMVSGGSGVWPTDKKDRPKLVCYFISERLADCYVDLRKFARLIDCDILVYVSHVGLLNGMSALHRLAMSIKGVVKICVSDGPVEFVASIRSAEWVLTDSFHAVMFSCIYGKNVRVVKPANNVRRGMFSRIEELNEKLICGGGFIVDSISDALTSFIVGPETKFKADNVVALRTKSQNWLRESLNGLQNKNRMEPS